MRWLGVPVFVVVVACAAREPEQEGGATEDDGSSGGAASSSAASSSEGTASVDTSTSGASEETSAGGCEVIGPDFTTPPSSMLDGMAVVPVGPGVRVELPEPWIVWHSEHANNLHLSREELELVREGSGEWDTEYALVLARLLDFDRCAAHVGGEGWAADSVSYGDLQLRVYSVAETPDAIIESAMTEMWDEITPEITIDETSEWTALRLSYDLSYGDYGGRANIELRMRRFGDATAVLAGMYVDGFSGAEQLAAIVASACWDSHVGECCGA